MTMALLYIIDNGTSRKIAIHFYLNVLITFFLLVTIEANISALVDNLGIVNQPEFQNVQLRVD